MAGRVATLSLISADGEYANPSLNVSIPTMYQGRTRDDLVHQNEEFAETVASHLRASYESMKNEARKRMAIVDLNEAVRKGTKGVAKDCILETEPWSFHIPEELPFMTHIYHGKADEAVPVRVAEWYGLQIKPSTLHLIEGENHSLIRRHWDEILSNIFAKTTTECAL